MSRWANWLTEPRRHAIRHGLAVAGVIAAAYVYVVLGDGTWRKPGADALVYWAVDPADPYAGSRLGGENAYLYSPAFAQLFAVFRVLPRELFVLVWIVLLAATAAWLARPWPAALLVLAWPLSQEVLIGNIHLLMAAAIVIGFRWPVAWAFVLLTKVTPGVGLLWFAVRREWRHLAIALGATAAIIAVSYALAPNLWSDWIAFLRVAGGDGGSTLLVRLVIAAAVVTWGARTDRAWTVPLAAMIALPFIWSDSFSMLLGCVALSRWRPAEPVSRGWLGAVPT